MLQAFSRKPKSFKVGSKSSLKIVVQKKTIMGLQSKLRNGLSDMFDEEISTWLQIISFQLTLVKHTSKTKARKGKHQRLKKGKVQTYSLWNPCLSLVPPILDGLWCRFLDQEIPLLHHTLHASFSTNTCTPPLALAFLWLCLSPSEQFPPLWNQPEHFFSSAWIPSSF